VSSLMKAPILETACRGCSLLLFYLVGSFLPLGSLAFVV